MTRPIYETETDRTHEQSVIEYACSIWNCEAVRMPRMYALDWTIQIDGQVKAMAEVKWRNKRYPTYIISAHKWHTAISLSNTLGIPALLLVCLPDHEGARHVIWAEMKKENMLRVIHAGRSDRGDQQDMEPCVEIDMSKFKRLE